MHDFDATRIFWKEWRAQRAFWLGLLALAVGLEFLLIFIVPLWRSTSRLEQLRYHEGLAVVLACAFATGSAAIAFAGEVEAKTKGLLQRMPVRARDLLAGKLTFALAGSYSLFLALWLIGGLLLSESQSMSASRAIQARRAEGPTRQEWDEVRAKAAVEGSMLDINWLQDNLRGPLAFVVVGSCVSLLLSDVLLTVLIAGVATSALWAIPIVRDSLPIQATVVAAALVCDFLLARRWLVNAGAVDWGWLPSISLPRLEFGRRHAIADHSATLESVRSPVAWRRAARSLLWKEFRQASLFCAAILVVGLVALAVMPFVEHAYWGKGSASLVRWVLCLAPLLPGVAAMRAERKGGAYQLLANHGIAVDGFLACKHAVWLALSLSVFGLLLVVDGVLLGNSSPKAQAPSLWRTALNIAGDTFGTATPDAAAGILVAVVHIVLLYALGFLLALLLPGPIVAVFTGVLIELAVILGWAVVAQLQIPFWWTIGLFPVILLAVGWVRTSDWVIGRGRSAWWKVAAVFFVPIAAMTAATVVYRVFEIPAVVVPKAFFEAQAPSALAPPSSGKRSLFLGAMDALVGKPLYVANENPVILQFGWESVTPVEREWIEKNSHARQLALEASQQEPGNFPSLPRRDFRDGMPRFEMAKKMTWLTQLLLYSAREFESKDQFDKALACYVAVARLGSDAARSDEGEPRIFGNGETLLALRWMQRWAAAPKQSTERVKKAIHEFAGFELRPGAPSISVLLDWKFNRHILRESVSHGWSSAEPGQTVAELWWVRWLLPWELVRLERLLDAVYSADLDEADAIGKDLREQGFVTMTAERARRWSRNESPWQYEQTTLHQPNLVGLPYAGPAEDVDRLAFEKMELIALALTDFKREHHKLPDSLQALVPVYFQHLPIDPWTGSDFVYESQGIPELIPFLNGNIASGTPFLASAGMYDSRLVRRLTTANGNPSYEVVSRFTPIGNLPRNRSAAIFQGPILQLR
jgi:hypothetical protein